MGTARHSHGMLVPTEMNANPTPDTDGMVEALAGLLDVTGPPAKGHAPGEEVHLGAAGHHSAQRQRSRRRQGLHLRVQSCHERCDRSFLENDGNSNVVTLSI